jgi:hypothetical protein
MSILESVSWEKGLVECKEKLLMRPSPLEVISLPARAAMASAVVMCLSFFSRFADEICIWGIHFHPGTLGLPPFYQFVNLFDQFAA